MRGVHAVDRRTAIAREREQRADTIHVPSIATAPRSTDLGAAGK
jgi:hypothetical protein